jgi:hypothetical protein
MFGVWKSRDGDRLHAGGAFQFERLFVRVTPWPVVLGATALGAYLIGLLALLPAEAAAGRTPDAVGTVWRGESALEPGFALGWTVRPVSSLLAFALEADARVRGPETEIAARVQRGPGRLLVKRADGSGSARLLKALAPALPVACDGEVSVRAENWAPTGGAAGEGDLRTGPLNCALSGATATAVPPLTGRLNSDAEGSGASLRTPANAELARYRAARDGAASLTITPEGAAAVPGLQPITLEAAP